MAFVANKHEREDIRDEQVDQASHASEETAKQAGEEIGADYQLQGVVNSITTEEGDQAVKFYQINLSLIDIKTGEKVWIGEKKIKKLITR